MRHKGLTRFALAAALVLLAAPAFSESFPIDVELGYRFVSISGNEEMYRSQINEREGFLLRSLTLSTADFPQVALSEDGRLQVVVVLDSTLTSHLLLRSSDELEPRLLPDTAGAASPSSWWVIRSRPSSGSAVRTSSPISQPGGTRTRGARWSGTGALRRGLSRR